MRKRSIPSINLSLYQKAVMRIPFASGLTSVSERITLVPKEFKLPEFGSDGREDEYKL